MLYVNLNYRFIRAVRSRYDDFCHTSFIFEFVTLENETFRKGLFYEI